MVQWLLPATCRRLATSVALAALTACASAPGERDAEVAADGWRVIERVGEARHLPPGDSSWRATITGRPISEGSEVTTGRGGRLIIAMPGRHISVGPASRFVLPSPDWDDRLEQRAGWLRYRVQVTDDAPFRVYTRSLEIEFTAAILDIRVEQGAIDVTVSEGKVRLATPDGLRRTEIAAGQSAHASGPGGTHLAVRTAPKGALEAVEPLIIPAVRPTASAKAPVIERPGLAPKSQERTPSKLVDPDRRAPQAPGEPAATQGAAAGEKLGGYPPARRTDANASPAAPASSGDLAAMSPRRGAVAGLAATGTARAAASAIPATGRRGQFERLSEGMIDGVRSPPPVPVRP